MPIRTAATIIFVSAFAAGGVQAQTAMPMDHAAHHAAMLAPPSGSVRSQ